MQLVNIKVIFVTHFKKCDILRCSLHTLRCAVHLYYSNCVKVAVNDAISCGHIKKYVPNIPIFTAICLPYKYIISFCVVDFVVILKLPYLLFHPYTYLL